jgi:hypothetical protein
MMMPSGSLLPERDARMRATASAGDRRVDVSGRSSLRYISAASRSTSRRWRCCSAAAAASRAASAGGMTTSEVVSLSWVMGYLSQN